MFRCTLLLESAVRVIQETVLLAHSRDLVIALTE